MLPDINKVEMIWRKCSGCGEWKDEHEYHTDNNDIDCAQRMCISCKKIYTEEYNALNEEKRKAAYHFYIIT